MPHWLIKSAIQRAISLLPASHWWNEQFQTRVTRSLDLTDSRFEGRLEHCQLHLQHVREFRPDLRDRFTVLEIGTGWFPVVPVGLFLCGAGEIWTFDIAPLVKAGRVRAMLRKFSDYARLGRLSSFLPEVRPERLAALDRVLGQTGTSGVEMLEGLGIHACTREAQNTGLPAASIDFFTSTGVLEYIPPGVLRQILDECHRVGREGALQSHYLNLVDQFSYFDRSITPFNFLKYSPRIWGYLNSPLTWQNRLRVSDFRKIFREHRFDVIKESNTPGDASQLRSTQIAPEFKEYAEEDLLVLFSWLAARRVP